MGPSFCSAACMRNTLVCTLSGSAVVLALAACGSARHRADDSSSRTNTTSVVVESGVRSPGDPMGNIPQVGGPTSSGGPASPMEGDCPRGDPDPNAESAHDCVKSCRGQDEAVPVGSKCMSQYESCVNQCLTR